MSFIIENTTFVKVPQIFFVKTNEYKLGKFKVKDNTLKGKINIDLGYFDSETRLHTAKLDFDYNLDLPENMDVEDLKISDLKLHTIDNLGVDCVYTLEIKTKPREVSKKKIEEVLDTENKVEVKDLETNPITEEQNKNQQPKTIIEEMKIQNAINEELKQELTNSYDKLLEENLEKREITSEQNDNIEIIILNEDEQIDTNAIKEKINKEVRQDIKTTESIIEVSKQEESNKRYRVPEDNEIINKEVRQEIKVSTPIIEELQVEEVIEEQLKPKEEEKVVNVEIISTSSKSSEDDFIRFFDSFETRYYSLKTIYCQSEEDLNKISKDYNISIETLLKTFDKQSKSVIVKDVNK